LNKADIIILDFGSQYTQLIARRLREEEVYCEILPYFETIEKILEKQPKGIIFSGGPASVYDENSYNVDKKIYDLGLPILGICYGMQRITVDFGGEVVRANKHEYGKAELKFYDEVETQLFDKCESNSIVWMSHGDKVEKLPEGFQALAFSENSPFAGIGNLEKNIYAFQFHPEVKHSEEGYLMLRNFAKKICGVSEKWNMGNFLKGQIAKIKKQVGDAKVNFSSFGGS